MSLSEFERLFLLEFFVDFVKIQNASFDYVESSLCVSFQFLHYPVMRVCEEEFMPKTRPLTKDSKIIFKSGKSCLFSVHSDEHKKIPSQFNLVIAVCQKMKCSDGRQLLGEASVSLGNSFMNLLTPPQELSVPASGVRHDLFPLKDKAGKVIGSIAAFARISCFGKLIVTEFQLAAEEDLNYMFKGTDVTSLLQDTQVLPNIDYEKNEEEMLKDTPYEDIFGYPTESEDEQEEIVETGFEEESGEGVQEKIDEFSETKSIEDHIKEDYDREKMLEEENYKEIGAEVNGHSIVIRVLKKQKKQKKSEDVNPLQMPCCCCPPEPPICPNAPKLNVCSCDYPLPPELIPKCPPQCCPPPPCCCCLPQSGLPNRQSNSIRVSFPKNISVSTCPREDCPLNIALGQQQPIDSEPNTVAVKGDYAFYHASNKPGEPMKEKEKRIANSLYFNKPSYNDTSKNASQPVS